MGKTIRLSFITFFSMLIFSFIPFLKAEAASIDSINESVQSNDLPSVTFDINDLRSHEDTMVLDNGLELKVGAEPVGSTSRAALTGTWRIWGDNGLARMEYYIVLKPTYSGSKYTRINNTYGLAVTGRLSGYSGEKISVVRANETSSKSAIVEGYAKFSYLGNQWVSIWTQGGGVRATIKNGKVTTKLY